MKLSCVLVWWRIILGYLSCTHVKVFIFKKFQGAKILIYFVKIGKQLPFTIKNKCKKQIWNLTFKNYHFGPPKKSVFVFEEIPPPKIFFFVFRLWFSFKNKRRKNVHLVGIFERKKTLLTAKMAFLTVNNFFCARKLRYKDISSQGHLVTRTLRYKDMAKISHGKNTVEERG